MRSRQVLVSLMLAVSVTISGCSGLLGGASQPAPSPLNADLGFQAQCLSDVLGVMERFTQGTASPTEVSNIWSCFASAITLFEKKVVGAQQDGFTGQEVAQFFEDRFLNGLKISDPLLGQIMQFKQIFVGGSATVITKTELLQLASFANQMNQISQQLLPYMKVYSMNWQPSPQDDYKKNVAYFEAANSELQNAVLQLTAMITVNQQPYDLRGLIVLFQELEKMMGQNWSWVGTLQKDFALVEKVKLALAGGDPDIVQAAEWNQFGILLARGYVQYQRYYYFIEEANQTGPQFVYFANSLNDLFGFLGDMVASKPTGTLTTTELMDLLNTINTVFPDLNFTQEFLTQFMNLKVVLFGGSATQFVQSDFKTAQSKVDVIRSVLERVWEYAPFYEGNWKPQDLPEVQAQQYFAAGEQNMQDIMNLLGANLNAAYDVQNIGALGDALYQLIVNPANRWTWAQSLKNDVNLVVAAKNMILADNTSVVQQTQWQPLLLSASDLYHRVLYYMYFLKPRSIMSGDGLNSADTWEKQLIKTLTGFVQTQAAVTPTTPVVPINSLLNLVTGAGTAGFLGNGLTAAAVQPVLQSLFGRLLVDPTARLSGAVSTGLSESNITRLDLEYQIWSSNQHLLTQDTVLNTTGQNQADLQGWLGKQTKSEGVTELQQVLTGSPSMIFNSQNRLVYSTTSTLYDLNSVSYANVARVIGRLLIDGYISNATDLAAGTGIVETDLGNALKDFQPLAVAFGLLSASNTTFASSRFFEANIFTPIADGNSYLNLGEATQITEMILSGLGISDQMSTIIGDQCTVSYATPGTDGPDDTLNVACVTQFYDKNIALLYQQAPQLVAYFNGLTSAVRQNIVMEYLSAAGSTSNASGTALRSDIELIPYVFQYGESMLQRYDLQKQGYMNYTDAVFAYPNFSQLMKQASGLNATAVNEGLFFYILTQQTVSKDYLKILPYVWDAWLGCSVPIKVDRSGIATILSAIVNYLDAQKISPAVMKIAIPAGANYPFMNDYGQ